MKPIGIIESDRLNLIPKRYWAQHEFCFHLHDLMVDLTRQMASQEAGFVQIEIESEEDQRLLENDIHALDFLDLSGRGDIERRVVVNQVSMALYSDMLNFIYEGLRALEKRKFTVAYSLLRKPFKEGMLIAAQMCVDEEAFFDRMKFDAKNLLEPQDKNTTISLLESAIEKCRGADYLTAESIYDAALNRGYPAGLAALFDKATHLVTGFRQIQTEDYNLNFIFKSPFDDDVYEDGTYSQLASLLLFLNLMQIELYGRMKEPSKSYQNWMLFTAIGTYESLFVRGNSTMVRFVNQHLKDFLHCSVCSQPLKLKKADAPRLFVGERIDCEHCSADQNFPLGWLLSQAELDLFGS